MRAFPADAALLHAAERRGRIGNKTAVQTDHAEYFEQIRAVDPSLGQALCHMMDLSVDKVAKAAKDLLVATESAA